LFICVTAQILYQKSVDIPSEGSATVYSADYLQYSLQKIPLKIIGRLKMKV